MTGILDKFYVEHGVQGARVLARSHQLTADCNDDDEVDTAIQMLKDDLDACAKEMKRLLEVNRRGSLCLLSPMLGFKNEGNNPLSRGSTGGRFAAEHWTKALWQGKLENPDARAFG